MLTPDFSAHVHVSSRFRHLWRQYPSPVYVGSLVKGLHEHQTFQPRSSASYSLPSILCIHPEGRSCAVLDPGKRLLYLQNFPCRWSRSSLIYPLVENFISSVAARNLSIYRFLANSNDAGRGSYPHELSQFFDLPRCGELLIATCFGSFIV